MSTRQLRRLEKELKKVSLTPQQQVEETESVEESQHTNPFTVLEYSALDQSEEELSAEELPEQPRVFSNQIQSKPKNSGLKKKRNKQNKVNSKGWDVTCSKEKEPSQLLFKKPTTDNGLPRVFWVNVSLLHSKHEIRKLFGSSIDSLQDSKERRPLTRGRRVVSRSVPVAGKLATRHRSLLVSPEVDWLGTPRDLRLTFVEEDISGYKWFRYDLEGMFVSTRNELENIVELGDPSLLVDFVSRYPYHVEALVRLSESYALMGEPERSVNLLERAIYILEGAWPANFKPFDGSCRLRFEEGANYLLFLVLFRYSQALVRRGLYQTSLQVTKLVYNLDWEHDPMGALLYMDTVAILAQDYKFVINSYESAYSVKLSLLVNYRLNYALAKYYLGHEDAQQQLVDTILTFPETICMMLKTWKVEIDETYLYILQHFSQQKDQSIPFSVSNIMDKISKVFVSVAESAWKPLQVRNWLLDCIVTACSYVEEGTVEVEDYANVCISEANLFSHVSVADFVHDSSSLPAHLLQQPIGMTGEETFVEEESNHSLWRILLDNLLGSSNSASDSHREGREQQPESDSDHYDEE